MTQPRFKIKKGDLVQVISGKDKHKKGLVQKVLLEKAKIFVEGVNIVVRHTKPSQTNPEGGKIAKNKSIDISNVGLVNPETGKIEKVGVRKNSDGQNERYFKKTGNAVVRG